MKFFEKISTVILLLVIVLVGVFHSAVISYFLKKVFSESSKGNITLTLDNFHFNVLNGDIVISNPVVRFENLYLDKYKNIKADEISYKQIKIEKLDIFSLIFDQEINAKRLLIDKPEFYFTESGYRNKSGFQPKGFMIALQQSEKTFGNIFIKIDEIEIHYGTITFSANSNIGIDPGQVDFTINLLGFNTHHKSHEANRLLYSDEFRFKMLNAHKILGSEYELGIDSVTFSSLHRDFVISGMMINPLDKIKYKNSIAFNASVISFRDIGLDDLREMEDLKLSSVELNRAKITSYINKKGDKMTGEDSIKTSGYSKFLSALHSLNIDTLFLDEVDYYSIYHGKDTLISARDINFMITELMLDTTMYADVINKIGFEDVSLNTGAIDLKEVIPGVSLRYEELAYSNVDDELELHDVHVSSRKNQNDIDIVIPALKLNGLSSHSLQKRQRQNISLYINDPSVSIIIKSSTATPAPPKKHISLPFDLYLYELAINNGDIKISQDSVFSAETGKFNVSASGISIQKTKDDTFKINTLSFSSDILNALIVKDSTKIYFSKMNYDNNLRFSNVKIEQPNYSVTSSSIDLIGLDRDMLLQKKELSLKKLILTSPVFEGTINIGTYIENGESKTFTSPALINIGELNINNGKIDSRIKIKDTDATLATNYSLSAGPIFLNKGDTLKKILNSFNWDASFDSINVQGYGHRIFVENIKSSSPDSLFNIFNLTVRPGNYMSTDSLNVLVKKLDIPLIDIKGIDYIKSIKGDTVILGTFTIESPDINILLQQPGDTSTSGKKNPLTDILPVFVYDKVGVDDLSLMLNRKAEGINKKIDLKGFNFSHSKNRSKTGNLLKDMFLKLDKFSMYDSISHSSWVLKGLKADSTTCTVYADRLSSGKHLNDTEEQAGTKIRTSGIKISGINISDSLPVNIKASMLSVRNIDVFITNDTIKRDESKAFSIRLKGLKEYKNIFASFHIDTADLGEVNFKIHKLGNLPDKIGKLDSLGVIVEGISIDSSMADKSNPEIVDKINIDLNGKTLVTADSLYEISSGVIHYNFISQKATIDSLYVKPLFEPAEFFRRAKFQTDRMDIFARKIELHDLGPHDLIENNPVELSRIDLYNVNADMYRDKHYPIRPDIIKPMPQEMLMSIKRTFNIDSLRVLDSYLQYREMGEKSTDPGEVFFDNMNLSAYNLANMVKEGEKKYLKVDFRSRIMGKAEMHINVKFPLHNDSVSFILTGNTEKMDLSLLNPLTTNLLGIGIIKGKGSVDVNQITGLQDVSTGNLIFRYKTLRIHPYSRKKEKLKKGPLSPLIKFMINDLVVKSNNPKFARKPRVGQVYFERDYRKGFINYIWKSVLSGLMSTMGFNSKEQRKGKKEDKATFKHSAALQTKRTELPVLE